MTKIALTYDAYTENTRDPAPGDDWDRGNTHTDWIFYGAKIAGDKDYETVDAPFDAVIGDQVYCLYAVWSTGDSFGQDDGHCMEFIDVFTDYDLARAALAALNTPCDTGSYDDWSVTYKRQDGTDIIFHRPWLGYFESLDDIDILDYKITPK